MIPLLERMARALLSPQSLTIIGSALGTALAAGLWRRWHRSKPVAPEMDGTRWHNRLGDE